MSGIRTNAAAVMLGVSPNTLRSWERRYGFPAPGRSSGGHRQYALAEIDALRLTLAETHNVSSAVALARERGQGPSSPARLMAAFRALDEEDADRLLEESLALRSLERTVQEVLLDALSALAAADPGGAEYEFAWRHAAGWMSAMKRLAPPATPAGGTLIVDGSRALTPDALYVQALELVLRRAGQRTLTLSATIDSARLSRAVRALSPRILVLAGAGTGLDCIGRLVYAVRRSAGHLPVCDFRGAVPDTGAGTVLRLPEDTVAARDVVLELGALSSAGPAAAPAPAAAATV